MKNRKKLKSITDSAEVSDSVIDKQGFSVKDIFDSYKSFFVNYTVFKGRSRRLDYWYSFLMNSLVFVVLSMLVSALGSVGIALVVMYTLAIIIPGVAITVRRLHDIGKKAFMLYLR